MRWAFWGVIVYRGRILFFTLAAVIFWRRSEDRMALFGSFMLLVFSGAAITGTMRDLAEAHPVFRFPTDLLNYVVGRAGDGAPGARLALAAPCGEDRRGGKVRQNARKFGGEELS
jgi:hypothetical protein